MKRIDYVYRRLAELSKEAGITTIELANDLGLARSNVSGDLNRLCNEHRAIKEGSKPIRYRAIIRNRARELPSSTLDRFAKKFPSLFQATEQAKAAVLYPPSGMPILLLGETGTGKSFFAQLIHEFSTEFHKETHIPFVIFNCADYADNPSLLVSHLFGARKGAYTGADTDKTGLLEKADGGILFLDEVHRLPPEGQEMLFSFFDRGTFRRLGDTDTEKKAAVQIIAATTEAPESVLLTTFTRRIPMIIKLPALHERSMDERLELIESFYAAEAVRLGKPIHVSVNSIRSLLGYNCPDNVGQLKTDVQLLCARAYSDFISQGRGKIQIVTANVPPHIKEGLFSKTAHREVWNMLTDVGSRFCVFHPERREDEALFEKNRDQNIYEMIDLRARDMHAVGVPDEEIEQNLDSYIRDFFSRFCCYHEETASFSTILHLADEETAGTIAELIEFAEHQLGRLLSQSIRTGIAMHVMNAIKRMRSGKSITNQEFDRIRRKHPAEFSVAVECLSIIDRHCSVAMPLEEAAFLCLFFVLDEEQHIAPQNKAVSVIVMCHGESTATSMAKTCNELLKRKIVVGIDVPLNEAPQTAWQTLKTWLSHQEQKDDVLLLVDMGSLTNLDTLLQDELDISSRTISMVSTLHVLQAAREAASGFSLERIYRDVNEIRDSCSQDFSEIASSDATVSADKCIVSICSTGEGTAQMVKDRLTSHLTFDNDKIRIVTYGLATEDHLRTRLEELHRSVEILFIITPFRMNIENIPEFNLEKIFDEKTLHHMQRLIDEEELFGKIVEAYRDSFISLKPKTVFHCARSFVKKIEANFSCELMEGVRIGIFCHISCMLDRIKSGQEVAEYTGKEQCIQENQALFAFIREEATDFEKLFGISVSDDEICYITSFFNPENCIVSPTIHRLTPVS